MAKVETKIEAVIHLTNEEVEEIRGWFSVIDWAAHPLAEQIYLGLGGDIENQIEIVSPAVDFGVVVFRKGA